MQELETQQKIALEREQSGAQSVQTARADGDSSADCFFPDRDNSSSIIAALLQDIQKKDERIRRLEKSLFEVSAVNTTKEHWLQTTPVLLIDN